MWLEEKPVRTRLFTGLSVFLRATSRQRKRAKLVSRRSLGKWCQDLFRSSLSVLCRLAFALRKPDSLQLLDLRRAGMFCFFLETRVTCDVQLSKLGQRAERRAVQAGVSAAFAVPARRRRNVSARVVVGPDRQQVSAHGLVSVSPPTGVEQQLSLA